MKGWMYMLECADGSYYTGSTNNLEERLFQHQSGQGANHTKKRLPVILVYFEEYPRIDEAFFREKQIQGWSRRKKKALINGEYNRLPEFAVAYRDGGFESLSYRNTESLSHRNTETPEDRTQPLSEALEDSDKKTKPEIKG
jgi:putative endonuclease